MRVSDALAAALADQGVDTVFGLLGDGNVAVMDAWVHEHGGNWYAATREDGAVLMADGYSRATGRIGFCSITHGPALTNSMTALTEAVRARTPLVMLASDTDPTDRSHPQIVDQPAAVAVTGAGLQQLRAAETVFEDVVLAFRRCLRERRPIVLRTPFQLLSQKAEGSPLGRERVVLPPSQRRRPEEAAIARWSHILTQVKRPIILAGRGAVDSHAHQQLIELADRLGALLGTTHLARDYFDGHEFNIGVAGGFSTEVGAKLYGNADCVIAFGASLNDWTTWKGSLFPEARVLQCDIDPGAFAEWLLPEAILIGDARSCAEELIAALADQDFTRAGYRSDAVSLEIKGADHSPAPTDTDHFDLRTALTYLDRVFPRSRAIVVDGGNFTIYACRRLHVSAPEEFIFPVNFGSIGLGLGTAIGVAVGRPDRRVLAVVGDGGFAMSLSEFDTAVRYQLPMVVVVINDGAYNPEYRILQSADSPVDLALFERPDYAEIARSLGGEGLAVGTWKELREMEGAIDSASGPLVIDVRMHPEDIPLPVMEPKLRASAGGGS